MGRSPPTEERAGSYPSLTADVTLRLQQLVAGWQGAERNQPVSELHNECLNAAGPGGRHLLPAILLLVKALDEQEDCWQQVAASRSCRVEALVVQFRYWLIPFCPLPASHKLL